MESDQRGFSSNNGKESIATSFVINDKGSTDKKSIVNGFCIFFSSVASTIKSKAFPLTNCTWKFTPQHRIHTDYVFTFELVSEQEVSKHLRDLNRNKAVGVDGIPPDR